MKKSSFKKLIPYIKKYTWFIILIILSAIVSSIISLAGPILIGKGIDNIISEDNVNFDVILKILGLLLVLFILNTITSWIVTAFASILSNRVTQDLRRDAFNHMSQLPLKYYDNNSRGDIISRLTNDIDTVSYGLLHGITQIVTGVILVLGSLAFMLYLSPIITALVLSMTLLSFIFVFIVTIKSNKLFRKQAQALGKLNAYAEEIIGGQKVVKAFNYEERSQMKYEKINDELYSYWQPAQFYSSLVNPGSRYLHNVAYILVAVFGSLTALSTGVLTPGSISSFLTYTMQFAKPINDMTSVLSELQATSASAKRIFDILETQEQSPDTESPVKLNKSSHSIKFEHVKFSYSKEKPLITDLNLDIKPGSVVAIAGPTGSGKTTLVNLLMRFYDIDSGSIKIDGVDIRQMKRDDLRNMFGMVLQDSWFFKGTIYENISYGKPDSTQTEVIQASKSARAHHFITQLPQGYDTILQEDGGNLSQGQRQLLTIARAMLASPPMLILDEATSSIDTRTEMHVQKALMKLMKNRTSFVIAHRLSTIREADLILVLKDGDVIEQGNHETLLKKNGFYHKLYFSQFSD